MEKQTAMIRVGISFGLLLFFGFINWAWGHHLGPITEAARSQDFHSLCKLSAMYGVIVAVGLSAYYYRDGKYTESELWGILGYGLTTFFGLATFMTFERAFAPTLFQMTYFPLSSVMVWCIVLGVAMLILALYTSTGAKSKEKPKDEKKKDDEGKEEVINDAEIGALVKARTAIQLSTRKAKELEFEILKKLKDAGHDIGDRGGSKPAEKKPDEKETPKEGKKE